MMNFRGWALCLLSWFAVCSALNAEVLQGRVVDAETLEPLDGAKVQVLDIHDGGMSFTTLGTDSAGVFRYTVLGDASSKLTIEASFFGYHKATLRRMGEGGNDTIRIPDLKLKPSAELMKEVVVSAKVKRFYMRGDTVVFNPQAFRLEDGDKLRTLIESLPGVSVKDGKLLWNGKPLKLMMNGKDALSQDMLMEVLPVEAVKDVKAYDRTSELQDRTGVADGNEEAVLDVTIKPGFMDKFYGEVEGKAYAGKEYAAHAYAVKASDTDPFLISGRVADEPTMITQSIGVSHWSGSQMPIRQQLGTLAYRHQWKPEYKVQRESKWDIEAAAYHTDRRAEEWKDQQVFMPNSLPTMTQTTDRDYQHRLEVPLNFGSFLNLGPMNTLSLEAGVKYDRDRKTHDTGQETYEGEDWLTRVNASEWHSIEENKGIEARGSAYFVHYFKGGSLATSLSANHENKEAEGWSNADYQYFRTGETVESREDRQYFSAPNHQTVVRLGEYYNQAFGKNVMVNARWNTAYTNRLRDEERLRNDVPDIENSTYRLDNHWDNTLHLDANVKLGKFSFKPSLYLNHSHEQTTYRRAALDTVALRNLLLATPKLELQYRFRGQNSLRGSVAYYNNKADLIDCIGYIDNTNPLYIRMGNPNLKTAHDLSTSLHYNLMLDRHAQMVSVSVNYGKEYDPIGTLMHYDSRTGAYRVQQQNMKGGDRYGGEVTYERDLTEDWRLSNYLGGRYQRNYGLLTLVDDATGMAYNQQGTSSLDESLRLIYDHGPWKMNARLGFSWRHYDYTEAASLTKNIYLYTVEANARYKLKDWTFMLMPKYQHNAGYTSGRMNGGQFLLGAEVSYEFLKKRAELKLEANDLLDQEKDRFADVTATSRTEGARKVMGRNISLTFTYRFRPTEKNKK